MANYVINYSGGTITLTQGNANTETGLTLMGQNYANYGEPMNQNWMSLLENFASNASPPNLTVQGMIWFDAANVQLKVNTSNGVANWQYITTTSAPNGNATFDTIVANTVNAGTFSGNGANITNINANNITSGFVSNARLAGVYGIDTTGTANFANFAGNVTVASQPNITSLGTLTSATISGNLSANNANITNNLVVGGNLSVTGNISGNLTGNISGTISAPGSNTQVLYNFQGNAAASANLTFTGNTLTVVGNANATVFNGSGAGLTNIPGANVTGQVAFASVANSVAGANVAGTVANAAYATNAGNAVNSTTATVATNITGASQPNITSVGTLSSLSVTGNISGGNITATGSITGNGAGLTNVPGSNVSGDVTNANYANFAGTAYSVSGANVTGTVANANFSVWANTAFNITGANVVGTVANANYSAFAGQAYAVSGSNVSGTVANANFAAYAGNVTQANQPNITSVGSLTNLTVSGNANVDSLNVSNGANITGNLNVVGTITGNVTGNISGNFVVPGSNTNILFNNQGNAGASGNLSFDGNTLSVIGNANATTFNGSGSGLTNIPGANVTGTVPFAAVANSVAGGNVSGTVANATFATSAGTAGTVTTAAQPNITSVGTLTGLNVNGQVNAQVLTSNVATGSAPLIVQSTTKVANLNADLLDDYTTSVAAVANTVVIRDTAGSIYANILVTNSIATTSVVNGNSNVSIPTANGNVNLSAEGNANVLTVTGSGANITGTLGVSGNANFGNVSASSGAFTSVSGNGAALGAINASNITTGTLAQSRLANSSVTFNGVTVSLGSTGTLTANTTQSLSNGSYLTGGSFNGGTAVTWAVDATSTNTANKIVARDANGSFSANVMTVNTLNTTSIVNGNSNVAIPSANGNVTVSVAGNANILTVTDTGVNVAGTLNATGNANVGNIGATNGVFTNVSGNGANLASLNASNITSGTLAQSRLANSSLTFNGITVSLGGSGTLTANTTQSHSNGAYITGGSFNGGTSVTWAVDASTESQANKIVARDANGSFSANIMTVNAINATSLVNGSSNVSIPAANGNVTISSAGNANIVVVTGTGANIAGTLNATGNANVGNLGATGVTATTLAGALTTNSQPNVTSLGTLTTLNVSAQVNATAFSSNVATGTAPFTVQSNTKVTNLNADLLDGYDTSLTTVANTIVVRDANGSIAANVLAVNSITATSLVNGNSNISIPAANGNVTISTAGNTNVVVVTGTGANVAGTLNATGNANVGNLGTAGVITATGNITGGNLITAGLISATGNITGGNLTTGGVVAATGNVSGGNLSTGGVLNVIGTGQSSIAGNLTMNSKNIINLAEPVNSQDAATKNYVDNVAQGLHVHAPCSAATPDTLANISAGTITYNNGSSGVGATLTTTGSYTTIDGVNIASVGTRVLVKNEANAARNGIYTYTSSTVLTRATDFDTPTEMAGGDFTFVTSGTLYNDTGWVLTDPVTTVGTTNVVFAQFSGAGTYTAGTGLTLNGTQFSISNTTVTAATYGNGDRVASFTVNSQGQLTAASNVVIAANAANLTGTSLNSAVVTSNLTTVGTLTALNVSAQANATAFSSNVATGTAPLTVQSTTKVANLNADLLDGYDSSITVIANTVVVRDANGSIAANSLSVNTITATSLVNGNSNVSIPAANGNINLSAAGNANVLVVTGTGANITGTLNVTGNANVGNIGAAAGVFTTVAGSLTTASQPNITGVGTITSGTWNNLIGSSATFAAGLSGANLASLTGANVTGTVPSATAATNASALLQNTSSATTVYPTFTTSSANGNSPAVFNTAFSANLANGALVANTFVGNLTGNINGSTFATFVTVSGAASGNSNASTLTGNLGLRALASTYTDNVATAGTIANAAIHGIGTPTLAAANVITATNAATFFIQNAPTAGTNVTIGNSWALYVGAGNSFFGANVTLGNVIGNGQALTGLNASNISSGTLAQARLANSTITVNGTTLTLGGTSTITANTTQSLSNGAFLTGGSFNGGTAVTLAVDATDAATASKVVARDANGSFSANAITANNLFVTSLINGNSNISIPAANGNVTISSAGNANVVVVTGTGANIAGTLNATGNANVGNLGAAQLLATANVTAPVLVSNTATGTAPLTVTSTTRVSNLNVAYANVSDFAAVTAQSTGIFYPAFVSGNASGNYALASNNSITANLANGALIATTLVGNITGNINGNTFATFVTVSGSQSGNSNASTLTGNLGLRALASTYTDTVAAAGTIANAAIHGLGTPTLAASNAITATNAATFFIQNAPSAGSNVTIGNAWALYVGAGNAFFAANVTLGNVIGNGQALTGLNASNISSGTLAQARLANSALTVNGTSISLGGSGTITANTTQSLSNGSFLTGGSFNGGTAITLAVDATDAATASKVVARDANGSFAGNVITANSFVGPITGSGANLTNLNASNVTTGTLAQTRLANSSLTVNGTSIALGASGTITANTTQSHANGAYLTGGSFNGGTAITWAVDATDAATANKVVARDANGSFSANIVNATYAIGSVQTGISANGSTQGTATALTKQYNIVSTVTAGQGVVLPTAVAGMRLTVINTSSANLLIYPASTAQINSLAANAAYQIGGNTNAIDLVAATSTQWYTINAVYS